MSKEQDQQNHRNAEGQQAKNRSNLADIKSKSHDKSIITLAQFFPLTNKLSARIPYVVFHLHTAPALGPLAAQVPSSAAEINRNACQVIHEPSLPFQYAVVFSQKKTQGKQVGKYRKW